MSTFKAADSQSAYGGRGWSPRRLSMKEEIGDIWGRCGIANEWSPLKAVLLHKPGAELENGAHPNDVQMLAKPDPEIAARQHDGLVRAYQQAGVRVWSLDPAETVTPNQMFIADAGMVIIIAARFENTTQRYGERGVRYVYMEAGHCAQNIHLEAVALGLASVPVGAYDDEDLKDVLGLEKEEPLYIIPVGYSK